MMDWLQVTQSLGIPVACLVALSYAVWRALIWVATNILKPLAGKHMEFIERVSASVESMTASMKELGESRSKELATTGTIIDKLDHLADKMDENTRTVTEFKSVVIKTQSVSVVPGGMSEERK